MITDVATFIGGYAFRHLDARSPEWLVAQMDRLGIDQAWVGHLPSILYRDPTPGTAALARALEPFRNRLCPVPTVNPDAPRWEDDLNFASLIDAPAVRVYPTWQGVESTSAVMRELVAAAAAIEMPLLFTVRLEDARQRHPRDVAPQLPAAAIRFGVRQHPDVRILVSNADRAFIEEVHFGLTPVEAARVLWDIGWVWGPPEDHLRTLIETVGLERFVFGTGMPLRIPDGAVAKLDLLDLVPEERELITAGNLRSWRRG
ncbi:MAG: hypothetical protein IH965_10575 [Gemmatimonadetes bacterium]|nr:hypothetical protein [Gemmatimonadota bacterium]